MKKVNEVFFGEHGLTSTSANHLANIAQEKIVSNEAKLKNLNFVTTTVDIVGSPENSGKVINKGYDETRLDEVRGRLSEIADMNAFCAWIREAIRAKETELNDVTTKSYDDWLRENILENDRPEFVGDATNDDVMAEMTVKELNEYFHLEATAATIGKYIHKDYLVLPMDSGSIDHLHIAPTHTFTLQHPIEKESLDYLRNRLLIYQGREDEADMRCICEIEGHQYLYNYVGIPPSKRICSHCHQKWRADYSGDLIHGEIWHEVDAFEGDERTDEEIIKDWGGH